MNPVSVALTVGILVVLGKWSRGKEPNVDNAIGVAGVAIGLAALEQINEPLAKGFGVLILVSVATIHVPKIAQAAGLISAYDYTERENAGLFR